MKTFIKDQRATGTIIGFTELIARAISVHLLSCRQPDRCLYAAEPLVRRSQISLFKDEGFMGLRKVY
jgi:hypothetical protein